MSNEQSDRRVVWELQGKIGISLKECGFVLRPAHNDGESFGVLDSKSGKVNTISRYAGVRAWVVCALRDMLTQWFVDPNNSNQALEQSDASLRRYMNEKELHCSQQFLAAYLTLKAWHFEFSHDELKTIFSGLGKEQRDLQFSMMRNSVCVDDDALWENPPAKPVFELILRHAL